VSGRLLYAGNVHTQNLLVIVNINATTRSLENCELYLNVTALTGQPLGIFGVDLTSISGADICCTGFFGND
jgi:hypothetical protein